MIGRNHHKMLSWESNRIIERNYQIETLSDILYNIQEEIGLKRLQKVCYTWGSGVSFSNLTKDEFTTIKSFLPELSILTKTSNQYGLNLKGTFAKGRVKKQDVHIMVEFKWGLPEDCKIEYKEVVKDADPEFYFIDKSGKIKHKSTETIVNCKEPLLESVFSS